MALPTIWRKNKPAVTNSMALSGISRPMEVSFRYLPNNQVIWFDDNQEELLNQGFLGNHAIFTIVDWKAAKVASAPPLLYEKKDDREFKKYNALMKSGTREGFMRAADIKIKALVEVEGSDIMKVFDRPNPLMSWFEFAYGHTVYKDIVGSAYWMAARAGSINDPTTGKIKEMYLPPAHHMRIFSGGISKPIDKYFLLTNPDVYIDAKNVCQIRNFSPRYDTDTQFLYGLPRLYAGRKILQKFNEGTSAEVDLFQKKGVRDIVSPKNLEQNTEVDYESFSNTRDAWNKKINEAGPGGIMINTTELTSIRVGFTPEELGLLSSQKVTKTDFCAMWHIPDIIFGWSDQTTYNNLAESRKIALTDAVLPELEAFKDGLNSWLVPSYYGENSRFVVDFDYDYFPELQEDLDKKLKRMKESNAFSVNEMRIAQGFGAAPDENSDKILVSGSYKLLENIGLESFAGDPDAIDLEE